MSMSLSKSRGNCSESIGSKGSPPGACGLLLEGGELKVGEENGGDVDDEEKVERARRLLGLGSSPRLEGSKNVVFIDSFEFAWWLIVSGGDGL
jgi:hypothetical protein